MADAAASGMRVRFWGVRGSIPTPVTPAMMEQKIVKLLMETAKNPLPSDITEESVRRWLLDLPFERRSTFGGNTTCVEVRCDDTLIVLDMGTGIRELGYGLMPETFQNKGLKGTILQSHVHWDHIQGYPFWPQLYMPRRMLDNRFVFYGGREWDRSLEEVLRGQMNPPVFPVDHRAIEAAALSMEFHTVYDGQEIKMEGTRGPIHILCRALNHPQETFGYRIEYAGQTITFCTDHEPYPGLHRPLLELADKADIFITDCQYSYHEYIGEGGKPQKLGWGHSYPEYIAEVANKAKPKLVVTTHHDPQASDERILELAKNVYQICGVRTVAAHEGLTLRCE